MYRNSASPHGGCLSDKTNENPLKKADGPAEKVAMMSRGVLICSPFANAYTTVTQKSDERFLYQV